MKTIEKFGANILILQPAQIGLALVQAMRRHQKNDKAKILKIQQLYCQNLNSDKFRLRNSHANEYTKVT